MAQASQTKNSFSFVKGLITEASALTFPEEASLDEDNFQLLRDGSRARRLGADYEDNFVLNDSGLEPSFLTIPAVSRSFSWKNVSQKESLSFLAIQIGNLIHFHDTSTLGTPTSGNKHAFVLNLDDHLVAPGGTTLYTPASFSSGKGFLFINTGTTEPLYVKYDVEEDTFEVVPYILNIRDFDGVEDLIGGTPIDVSFRPVDASDNHLYNLRNQGWPREFTLSSQPDGSIIGGIPATSIGDPAAYTKDVLGVFPSNSDIIYLAKLASSETSNALGAYHPSELDKTVFGNAQAPRGTKILNALKKDRGAVSGLPSLPVEVNETRPSASTFFSGRIFLGVGTSIYYSQIIKNEDNISRFYQEADPTAEIINDLVDTDGGVIEIPEAGFIRKLAVTRDKVIVLADQGVWIIDGGSDPFTATNQRAYKISNIGVTSNNSSINVENNIIFTTPSGIYSVTSDGLSGEVGVQNLTETTIQTFYLEIPDASRGNFKPVYDPTGRKVYWFYSSLGLDLSQDRVLVLDTILKAFYKYSIDTSDGTFPFIMDGYINDEVQTSRLEENVTDESGGITTTESAENVTVEIPFVASTPSTLQLITGIVDGTKVNYTVSEFVSRTFLDWTTHDISGKNYISFLLTGYDTQDDILRYQQAPYIQCAFNRTENGFVSNDEGGVEFRNPSGCFLQTRWDWSDNFTSGKISSTVGPLLNFKIRQVYRFKRPAIAGVVGDDFTNGLPVVTTRNKIRGRGKALHLGFFSERGKDCQLLGWSTNYTGTTEP